jgi:hypothetical protein
MFHPACAYTVKKDRLYRHAVLDLAEYRHAWDHGASKSEQDRLHQKVCASVAALRVYDRVRAEGVKHIVTTEQFWTLAERYSNDHGFRAEMRFPSKQG